MLAGHLGVALAAARVEPRVGVGTFAVASLLLDGLLWLFVLLGWESVVIPPDYPKTHQPAFVFPYSHGLLASLLWSALAGALVLSLRRPRDAASARPAWLVAGVVFSHWLLDALVHRPELPLAGVASPHRGFGLWNDMPVALAVEAALVSLGMWLYFPGCALPAPRKLALAALNGLVLVFTVVGMTAAPPPPSAAAMAGSSLGTIVLVCALIGWLGSRRGAARGRPPTQGPSCSSRPDPPKTDPPP